MYTDQLYAKLSCQLLLTSSRNRYTKNGNISNADREAVAFLINQLTKTFASPMSISQCAKNVCMSKSKLSFVFRQVTGKSILEYYQMLRIQRSKELLYDKGKGIEEIANAVGYNTHAAFSAMFKASCGLTPYEYRKSKNANGIKFH